jgi:RNA polymerase sigma-70 factor (ECF subfamily)
MTPGVETRPAEATWFEPLYQQYRRPVLMHLLRLIGEPETAEDLCQETFLKAIRGWERRDPTASLTAWLYRIATNTAYDHLRRRRRISFTPLVDGDDAGDFTTEIRYDEQEPVLSALAQLPAIYRNLLVLHSYQGCSTQEIAAALGSSDGAVRTRLFRARERFRDVYQG